MLHLRIYGPTDSLVEVGGDLEDRGVACNVALAPAVRAGHVLLTAEVFAESADAVLELLAAGTVTLLVQRRLAPAGTRPDPAR
jgi:hypothetical protein